MTVHRYPHNAGSYANDDSYKPRELDDYDLRYIENAGYDAMWYWYGDGGYDGTGYALLTKPGDPSIYSYYLGHCSCYGPTEHIVNADQWESLDALENGITRDYAQEIKPLVKMMREAQ